MKLICELLIKAKPSFGYDAYHEFSIAKNEGIILDFNFNMVDINSPDYHTWNIEFSLHGNEDEITKICRTLEDIFNGNNCILSYTLDRIRSPFDITYTTASTNYTFDTNYYTSSLGY
jgi:hypothetical protein